MQPLKLDAVRSEINVTPLVDVVLVLLIIFMVVTPMLTKGPPVSLPGAKNPPKKPDTQDQILITVGENGSYWLENKGLGPDELIPALQDQYRREPGRVIAIKADAKSTYGDVKRVLLAVKDGGFPEAGLIVEKLHKAKS